jgi:hypothetical protein
VKGIVWFLGGLAFLLFADVGAHAETRGNLILRGGAVYTLDSKRPWATAIVIQDGRIVYVGDDAGARAFQRPGSRVIALRGRMVLPGFHDAHAHPMSGAIRLLRCRLDDFPTAAKLYKGVSACAAAKPAQAWLIGYGIPQHLFDIGTLNRAKLDALVPDRPAFLTTEDGFAAWVNSKALAIAGIDPEGTDPQIEGVERDPKTHKPTGVLKDEATNLVRRHVPKPSEAEYREALRRATAIGNRFGITSIFDASATAAMLDAYRAADLADELTVRIVAAQRVDPERGPEQVDDMIARRDQTRGRRFRADAAKIFLDVEISNHSAALLEPYADAPNTRGELLIQTDALNAIVRRLDAEGFLIHMHAMGDRAVRVGLDAIEQAMRANGPRDRRHQIAHIGVADPADIARFCKLGVAANIQPRFAVADDPALIPGQTVLGPARTRWMYPFGSIAACGATIVASSDWPQPSMNPLDEIQAGLTRRPLDSSKPAEQPEQRLDRATMLTAYTKNAAWAARAENIDGSIEVGKAADLVVLDRNLFKMKASDIHQARVLLTLLDGEVLYRDPRF